MTPKENLATIPETPAGEMRLVTFKEACRYARIGRNKLYELITAGKIMAYKDGHLTKIDLNSIDAYHRTLPRFIGRARPASKRRRQ